jgi:voltage-gated potassium channel
MELKIREYCYSNSLSSQYFNSLMELVVFISIISILGYDSAIPINIGSPKFYKFLEFITIIIFAVEMALRFVMTFRECKKRKPYSFIKYITSYITLLDILSIIPYYTFPYPYRVIVLIARILKLARFSQSIKEMLFSIQEKTFELSTVFFIFVFFVFGASIVMFSLENKVNPGINTLFDAFWWSIVTVTTVGYGDIKPVTSSGRIIASILMVLGISGIAILTGIITTGFTDRLLKLKLNLGGVMEKKIAKLSNHYIICGYGRVGKVVASELERFHKQFVIIEEDKDAVKEAIDHEYLTITGSATNEEILKKAKIKEAMGIALVMNSDADNLYTLITAKDENREILAIARANTEESIKKFVKLGAKTISPYQSSGYDISRMLISPRTAEFVSIIMQSDKTIEMGEFFITKDSPYANKKIKDTDIRSKYNLIIIAITEKGKETIFNPKAEDIITPKSTLICVGTKEDMEQLEKIML